MPPERRSARRIARGKATDAPEKTIPATTGDDNANKSAPTGGKELDATTTAISAGSKGDRSSDTQAATTTSRPKPTPFTVPGSGKAAKPIPCLHSHGHSPSSPPLSLIFTHGAGGDLSAPAMTNFLQGFASTGAAMVSFQGNMNLKARTAMFAAVKAHEAPDGNAGLAFGGRSMGARAAVMAAETDETVTALVLASYPLVGPKDIRDQALLQIRPDVDVLFISGDADHMCPLEMLLEVMDKMQARSWLCVVAGADHGMNIKGGKNLKAGTERVGMQAGRVASRWIADRASGKKDEVSAAEREMVLRWDGVGQKVLGLWGVRDAVTTEGHERADGAGEKDGGIKRYFTQVDDKDSVPQGEVPQEDDTAAAGSKRKRTKR